LVFGMVGLVGLFVILSKVFCFIIRLSLFLTVVNRLSLLEIGWFTGETVAIGML